MSVLLYSRSTFTSFKQTFFGDKEGDILPVITIGVIEPQTGRYAEKGIEEIKGIELANSIYNNVDGYRVELAKVDTKSTVGGSEVAIQALIKMNPVAIIGSAGEATSLAIGDYIDKAEIPTVTPSATNPLITQNSSYYFRCCLTEPQMGRGIAEYADSALLSDRIAVVSVKNDTSASALIDGFYDALKDSGFSVSNIKISGDSYDEEEFRESIKKVNSSRERKVISAEINVNDDDINRAVQMIKSIDGMDACLFTLGVDEMDSVFSKVENDEELKDVVFMGTKDWGGAQFVSMVSSKHPGMISSGRDGKKDRIVFPYESVLTKNDDTSDTYTEEAQRFQIEYAGKYGSDDTPTDNAVLGYDSYLLLINAIHNAKSLEGDEIRSAMMKFDGLKCATGMYIFDSNGNVVRSVTLSTIRDGRPVTEYVTKSEAEAKELKEINASEEADN